MKPIQDCLIKLAPDRIDFDLLDHLSRKAVGEHVPRQRGIDATAFQIEQLFVGKLANGRPVSALHIVRKNFKLRLRIDLRFV